MPTATVTTHTTTSTAATIALKSASYMPSSSGSTVATLKSLYPRAATAFLQRNILLTHSLLSSAFSILSPPQSPNPEDSLSSYRRKWDLLRITFETTLYSSPPPDDDPEALPSSLRANQMLSPQSFVAALHSRSLQLYTPGSPAQKPTSAYLPAQILVTLGLASLKLGCPDIGRGIVEDWLARRSQLTMTTDHEGYAKVLDLYCLQILPRLEEWDYAADFLQYERELSKHSHDHMISSLHALRAQAQAARQTPSPVLSPPESASAETSRTVSPAPSISSESSNSTHTATPTSPRLTSTKAKGKMRERIPSMTHIQSSPSTSSSSQSISSIATSATITPATVQTALSRQGREQEKPVPRHQASFTRSRMKSASPLPRPPRSLSLDPPNSAVTRSPSMFAIIRSFLDVSLHNMTKSKAIAFILLVVVFPLLSLVFRLRRRKIVGPNDVGVADSVRRRLQAGALEKGVIAGVWQEVVRSVVDTVKMGGRGLV